MATPASLTQVSMRPKRAIASSARRCTCSRSATSQGRAMACPPAAVMRRTASSRVWSLRAERTTLAPFFAAVSAVPRPDPLEAPGVSMTCWFRGLMADYLKAAAGLNIVQAVYMEVAVEEKQRPAEAEYVIDLCRRGAVRDPAAGPTVAAVIGGSPGGDGFAGYIKPFKSSPYVKGV